MKGYSIWSFVDVIIELDSAEIKKDVDGNTYFDGRLVRGEIYRDYESFENAVKNLRNEMVREIDDNIEDQIAFIKRSKNV